MQTAKKSDYSTTQKTWNEANKAKRQEMLLSAGYSKSIHYSRAFNYLPQWVREDLIYCHLRKQQPPSKTNKPMAKPKLATDHWYSN